MAPELWRGERASVASDIYALGVMLHESGSRGLRGRASEVGTDCSTVPASGSGGEISRCGCGGGGADASSYAEMVSDGCGAGVLAPLLER